MAASSHRGGHHLADTVAALDVELSDDDVRRLAEPYRPQASFWW